MEQRTTAENQLDDLIKWFAHCTTSRCIRWDLGLHQQSEGRRLSDVDATDGRIYYYVSLFFLRNRDAWITRPLFSLVYNFWFIFKMFLMECSTLGGVLVVYCLFDIVLLRLLNNNDRFEYLVLSHRDVNHCL